MRVLIDVPSAPARGADWTDTHRSLHCRWCLLPDEIIHNVKQVVSVRLDLTRQSSLMRVDVGLAAPASSKPTYLSAASS